MIFDCHCTRLATKDERSVHEEEEDEEEKSSCGNFLIKSC